MLEIEKKFLVRKAEFRPTDAGQLIQQAYLMRQKGRSLRVRKREGRYTLTVKLGEGLVRHEVERELNEPEGEVLMAMALEAPIVKRRYRVPYAGKTWDVDVFHGDNEGLVLAEVELGAPDELFEAPKWLGREVTGQRRFHNSELAKHPYKEWRDEFEATLTLPYMMTA